MSPSSVPSSSLLKHFETFEDPRTAYLIEHRLLDIMGLTICAVICGAEGWEDIEAYGRSKFEWLKTFLALPNGIPSHDTISRVFARLEPSKLQEGFVSWVKTIAHETIDKGHGRLEKRRYYLLSSVEHLVDAHQWAQLKRVDMIESERRIEGKPTTTERRYYLTSLDGGIEDFARASRGYWGIENRLHWSLDVVFHEDDSHIRTDHSPENMTLIRKIALNLVTKEASKGSKKRKRLKAGWDNDFLIKVLLA